MPLLIVNIWLLEIIHDDDDDKFGSFSDESELGNDVEETLVVATDEWMTVWAPGERPPPEKIMNGSLK